MIKREGAATILVTLAIAGCASDGQIAVRPLASPFAAGEQPASIRVAEARGQFALGNVALAAEGFRRALREEPGSVDALNGLAACYDKMGRFDLSRPLYEKALALAPGDARLYANLALSLELQGRGEEAASLRKEATQRFAAAATAIPLAPPVQSPPPAPTALTSPAPAVSVALAEPVPEPAPAVPASGPRLERIGLGEVALRTGGPVRWAALSAKPATAATPGRGSAPVMVLNGTERPGLAAVTRTRLQSLGWKGSGIVIGNAAEPLRSSQILYSADRAAEARRLARQLGLPIRQREGRSDRLVIQLGRDRVTMGRPTA